MRNKGQTEVMGLVVIVVLFVMILMFYIAFSLNARTPGILEGTVQIRADYMMDAVLKYTPECYGIIKPIREIIKECDFDANNEICHEPCMDLLKEESRNIIRLAPKEGNRYGYDFKIEKRKNNAEKKLEVVKCDASTAELVMTDNQPIYGGNSITMKICVYK